jgi:(S)-3,5-dihydroxyphenylglycine transaminase
VYLGTYSKTLCPAVRVGCAVVPDRLFGETAAARAFATALAERKSFLTVYTSQINQALVGGVLIAESGSLRKRLAPAVDYYRRNRDLLVQCLQEVFGGFGENCAWNVPEGGFFLTLRLPFRFGQDELIECAGRHGVIPMPMSYFSFDNSNDRLIRLAFSNISGDSIRDGIARFAGFVDQRCRMVARVDD